MGRGGLLHVFNTVYVDDLFSKQRNWEGVERHELDWLCENVDMEHVMCTLEYKIVQQLYYLCGSAISVNFHAV